MAGISQESSKVYRLAPRDGGRRFFGRALLRDHERTDLAAQALPPEVGFLAAEGFSPERLLNAVNAAPKAVSPLDRLLSEGLIHEEVYYRALAKHLGCEYYYGEPPLAANFDAMRGLRSGVAPLEFHPGRPRAVIAPRAQYVPRVMEAAQSSRLLSGSFALTSPQRFAGLMRARRGKELLDVALGRLPASLSARRGMTWAQIAAVGGVVASASALGVASFEAFHAAAIAALWLMFSASVILRSTAAVASNGEVRPPTLADDELPDYTVVAALYRERRVAEQLVRALDALDYPGIMAQTPYGVCAIIPG
jgi:hypothetical protein